MKGHTRLIHQLVSATHSEELFVGISRLHPLFRKCIPLPSEYKRDTERTVVRDHVRYRLRLHDFMQWYLFADLPDIAWKLALPYCKPGSIILDIGANCGHFSLKVAVQSRRMGLHDVYIHAFEPNPDVNSSLKENLRLNAVREPLVFIHSVALGDENELRFFDVSEENMGAGRVLKPGKSGKFEVTVQRLDDWVNALSPASISFIKMDVEGFEPNVFRGAWETISRFMPAIYFEVTPQWYDENGENINEVFDRLLNLGYRLQQENEGTLRPLTRELAKDLPQYNIFALHEPG